MSPATSDVVLRIEHLSKQFRIGARREPYRTMRDTLAAAATAPLRWLRRPDAAADHYRAVLALDPDHREASEHVGRGKKRVGLVGKWLRGDDE